MQCIKAGSKLLQCKSLPLDFKDQLIVQELVLQRFRQLVCQMCHTGVTVKQSYNAYFDMSAVALGCQDLCDCYVHIRSTRKIHRNVKTHIPYEHSHIQ